MNFNENHYSIHQSHKSDNLLGKQFYTTSMSYDSPQQQSSQQHQQNPQNQQHTKEFEQPRYYSSPMIVQQPPYVQVPTNPQYTINQSIIYPSQQQYYESIPVNNYLLIPNSNTNNLNTNNTYYNSNYVQTSNQLNTHSSPVTSTIHHQTQPQQAIFYSNFNERLQSLLPAPPLAKAKVRPDINLNVNQKRAKRKSKFTKRQDELIVSLKKNGRSWVEIAELSGVGSYLAARNRYQVIVGQQGNNNSSSWTNDDKELLRNLLDEAELEKWRYIATELNKATNKNFTDKECRELIRMLFWTNPASFGVNEESINECVKEKKITDKANEQGYRSSTEQQYAQTILEQTNTATANNNSDNNNNNIEYKQSNESVEHNNYSKHYY